MIFARTVLTPPTKRAQDVRIRAVDDSTVTLSATIDSMTPGRYGLWFSEDTGHARVGEIVSFTTDTVTRQLLQVSGFLATFTGFYFTVVLVTDETYRREFRDDVVAELREALAVRAAYRQHLR